MLLEAEDSQQRAQLHMMLPPLPPCFLDDTAISLMALCSEKSWWANMQEWQKEGAEKWRTKLGRAFLLLEAKDS